MTFTPPPVVLLLAEGVSPNALRPAAELLGEFGVDYRESSFPAGREVPAGTRVVIVASADAGAPASLSAGSVPVIRVPVEAGSASTRGLALLTGAEPGNGGAAGPGFATVALGHAGAVNAALLAVAMLAAQGDERVRRAWSDYRASQTATVLARSLPMD